MRFCPGRGHLEGDTIVLLGTGSIRNHERQGSLVRLAETQKAKERKKFWGPNFSVGRGLRAGSNRIQVKALRIGWGEWECPIGFVQLGFKELRGKGRAPRVFLLRLIIFNYLIRVIQGALPRWTASGFLG